MTSNQRRPGFRLPWSAEGESAADEPTATNGSSPEAPTEHGEVAEVAVPVTASPATSETAPEGERDEAASEFEAPVPAASSAASPAPEPRAAAVVAEPPAAAAAEPPAVAETPMPGAAFAAAESPTGFMRDLVAAMRRVAEETRQASLGELRTKSEEQVRALEAETERRREELRMRAETDIEGVGEWERAEQERIKQEAEQKVVSRRAQLDQQLAEEMTRSQAATQALRDRVAAYERELDAYHAQLSDIADPAAFASAAKRMPPPPQLGPATTGEEPASAPESGTAAAADAPAEAPVEEVAAPVPQDSAAEQSASDSDAEVAPASSVAATSATGAQNGVEAAAATSHETVATEVLVKGLGSFGAITGFRQALAGVEGIEGVSLSLGPTGEFVFRAIHPAGFDVGAAIKALEGDAAVIEDRAEGGLRVTLERSR